MKSSQGVLLAILFGILSGSCGSRSDLKEQRPVFWGVEADVVIIEGPPNSPPEAVCPGPLYASPRKPAVLHGGGTDDGWIASYLWEVEVAPPGSVATPQPANSATAAFRPDVAGTAEAPAVYVVRLTVTDNEGEKDSCTTEVRAVAGPPVAFCPEDQAVTSGGRLQLDGDAYDDGYITAYLWEITAAPAGSQSYIELSTQPDSTFVAGAQDRGSFTVRFTVTDDEWHSGSCELQIAVGGAPEAICPEDMTVPTRTETTLVGDAEDDGTIVSWLWECILHDTDTPPHLGTPTLQTTTFLARRVGHYTMRLRVTDNTGLSDDCTFTIRTLETPPTAICPTNIETIPLVELELRGSGEDDGAVVAYRWELISSPPGSSASPPDPPTGQVTRFMPDVAGVYVMRLTVVDDLGNEASCEFEIRASSGEGLRVEMYWNPPENPHDRSDVDLHLLHPDAPHWFHSSLDCFYGNCDSRTMVLEWDNPGPDDNPRLDLDDVDGYGPENINIYAPLQQVYRVGVHYYADEGMGPARVYVKIYCGEISIAPVYEVGPKILNGHHLAPQDNDFWKVADVEWRGFTCNVTPIDQVVTGAEAQSRR